VGVSLDVVEIALRSWDAAEHRDVRSRCAVEQECDRNGDADEQAREGVEDEHAEQGGERGDEVWPGGEPVHAAEPGGVEPVELDE